MQHSVYVGQGISTCPSYHMSKLNHCLNQGVNSSQTCYKESDNIGFSGLLGLNNRQWWIKFETVRWNTLYTDANSTTFSLDLEHQHICWNDKATWWALNLLLLGITKGESPTNSKTTVQCRIFKKFQKNKVWNRNDWASLITDIAGLMPGKVSTLSKLETF